LRAGLGGGRSNQAAYPNLAQWMEYERHFTAVPRNVIFITNEVVGFKPDPCAGCTSKNNVNVLTFTDTGLAGGQFDHPYWWGGSGDTNGSGNPYFTQQSNKLKAPYKAAFYYYTDDPFKANCAPLWQRNPQLPSSQYNGSFYNGYSSRGGSSMTFVKSKSSCVAPPVGPGWTTANSGAADNPQFRMPVLYVGGVTQNQPTVSCSTYQAGADEFVPLTRWSGVAQTYTACGGEMVDWLDAQLGQLELPSAVTKTKAKKVKKHKATLTWKAPKRVGHGKLVKYQTRIKGPGKGKPKCRKSRGGCWTAWRKTDSAVGDRHLKHIHRDLKPGKKYRIQVRAVSTVGPGKAKTVVVRTKRGGVPTKHGKG
jgi:hypothetical protein